MSITPQFLDELRARVPISEVVGRFVSWDQKKSRPAQGDYWAPCPFHSEKTASFHADDRKGFYYCFGCHQKGDAINFLKDKGNLNFVDAVRELASMAGMEMPALDPRAKEKSDQHGRLIDLHERAARFFSRQLHAAAGTQALDYLKTERGLSDAIIEEFGLGFAPNARDLLLRDLREAGFADEEILQSGLALQPEERAKTDHSGNFDRFRARIMFPIHDARGRVIAFGGRAMTEAAKAKYLNSPETPIFHKSHVVYNLNRARMALGSDQSLIVTEGYMDVIALASAGISTAIAPMGTAITLEQIQTIWRADPAPILALDGDRAGLAAASRAAQIALPHIAANRTLRFALMPEGQDPDDVVRKGGAKAIKTLLEESIPMVDMIWRDAMGDAPLDTPEARAAFDAKLKAAVSQIADASLKSHYFAEFRQRRSALWSPTRQKSDAPRSSQTAKIKRTKINDPQDFRTALVLRAIFSAPAMGKRFVEELSLLRANSPEIERLRKEVVMAYGDETALNLIATDQNKSLLDLNQILREFRLFNDEETEARALEIAGDDLMRFRLLSQAEAEIEHLKDELKSETAQHEETEALLAQAILLRDEARKTLDEQNNEDEDFKARNRQFLESERWRK